MKSAVFKEQNYQLKKNNMNNNLEFENTDPKPDSVEDNHPRTNYGAKWQQERMYSEEEIFNLCRDFAIFVQQKRPSYKKQLEWFQQFKNK